MAETYVVTEFGIELSWGHATDVGKLRQLNEDSFLALPGVYVVADGMGGHQAGDVASRLVVESIEADLSSGLSNIGDLDGVIQRAHESVRRHSTEAGKEGMGSTLVGVFLVRNGTTASLVAVNVGDSRCYRLADGHLERLTKDHSHVQELIDAGVISADDAAHHPERNVVTRAIGIDPTVVADFFVLPAADRSRLVLCSDGVSGEVPPGVMDSILIGESDPQAAADALIAAVLAGRAADNATVVVVDVVMTGESDEDALDDAEITGPRPSRSAIARRSGEQDEVDDDVITEVPVSSSSAQDDSVLTLIDEVPG